MNMIFKKINKTYQHCCTKIKFVEELSDENVNLKY